MRIDQGQHGGRRPAELFGKDGVLQGGRIGSGVRKSLDRRRVRTMSAFLRGLVAPAACAVAVGSFVVAPLASGGAVPPGGSYTAGLELRAGSADNDIAMSFDGSRYVISDQAGITGCTQIDPQTVSCAGPTSYPEIVFTLDGGDDRASFAATIPGGEVTALGDGGNDQILLESGSSSRARFSGLEGDDTLTGATSKDFLSGGRGDDVLRGKAGDDRLLGTQGRDRFVSGTGDDEINAAMNDRDRAIRCGPGQDKAIIDRHEDPEPAGCEKVVVR
jgi:hypothetical protein